MRRLFAWVTSFTTQDQIVNRAVRELGEIARQNVGLIASMPQAQQCQGYQQARLRRIVREFVATLRRGQRPMSSIARKELSEAILKQLSGELWSTQRIPVVAAFSPREAA